MRSTTNSAMGCFGLGKKHKLVLKCTQCRRKKKKNIFSFKNRCTDFYSYRQNPILVMLLVIKMNKPKNIREKNQDFELNPGDKYK